MFGDMVTRWGKRDKYLEGNEGGNEDRNEDRNEDIDSELDGEGDDEEDIGGNTNATNSQRYDSDVSSEDSNDSKEGETIPMNTNADDSAGDAGNGSNTNATNSQRYDSDTSSGQEDSGNDSDTSSGQGVSENDSNEDIPNQTDKDDPITVGGQEDAEKRLEDAPGDIVITPFQGEGRQEDNQVAGGTPTWGLRKRKPISYARPQMKRRRKSQTQTSLLRNTKQQQRRRTPYPDVVNDSNKARSHEDGDDSRGDKDGDKSRHEDEDSSRTQSENHWYHPRNAPPCIVSIIKRGNNRSLVREYSFVEGEFRTLELSPTSRTVGRLGERVEVEISAKNQYQPSRAYFLRQEPKECCKGCQKKLEQHSPCCLHCGKFQHVDCQNPSIKPWCYLGCNVSLDGTTKIDCAVCKGPLKAREQPQDPNPSRTVDIAIDIGSSTPRIMVDIEEGPATAVDGLPKSLVYKDSQGELCTTTERSSVGLEERVDPIKMLYLMPDDPKYEGFDKQETFRAFFRDALARVFDFISGKVRDDRPLNFTLATAFPSGFSPSRQGDILTALDQAFKEVHRGSDFNIPTMPNYVTQFEPIADLYGVYWENEEIRKQIDDSNVRRLISADFGATTFDINCLEKSTLPGSNFVLGDLRTTVACTLISGSHLFETEIVRKLFDNNLSKFIEVEKAVLAVVGKKRALQEIESDPKQPSQHNMSEVLNTLVNKHYRKLEELIMGDETHEWTETENEETQVLLCGNGTMDPNAVKAVENGLVKRGLKKKPMMPEQYHSQQNTQQCRGLLAYMKNTTVQKAPFNIFLETDANLDNANEDTRYIILVRKGEAVNSPVLPCSRHHPGYAIPYDIKWYAKSRTSWIRFWASDQDSFPSTFHAYSEYVIPKDIEHPRLLCYGRFEVPHFPGGCASLFIDPYPFFRGLTMNTNILIGVLRDTSPTFDFHGYKMEDVKLLLDPKHQISFRMVVAMQWDKVVHKTIKFSDKTKDWDVVENPQESDQP